MDFLTVGKIVNTHALQGEVKVLCTTDFKEERFKKGNTLYIDYQGGTIPVTIASHRQHKGAELLKFSHLNSINDVEKYKGSDLLVPYEDLDELEENEFYYHEVIGCRVVSEAGEEIGEVTEILETGANDVWVIKRPGQKDALIPYIEDVVKAVDVEKKQIIIHILEGLL